MLELAGGAALALVTNVRRGTVEETGAYGVEDVPVVDLAEHELIVDCNRRENEHSRLRQGGGGRREGQQGDGTCELAYKMRLLSPSVQLSLPFSPVPGQKSHCPRGHSCQLRWCRRSGACSSRWHCDQSPPFSWRWWRKRSPGGKGTTWQRTGPNRERVSAEIRSVVVAR